MASDYDAQIQSKLSTLCGEPAVLPGLQLLLKTEVKNTMKKENLIKSYSVAKSICDTVFKKMNDLEVTLACQEALSPFDLCDNATDALGDRFNSISVRCQAGGSRARLHPPCTHPCLDKEGAETVPEQRPRVYRCSACGQIEKSMHEILQHQRVQHYQLPRVDETNSEREKSRPKLVKSNCNACTSSHILGLYSCRNCSFSSTCPFALEKHMNQVHDSQQLYHCPICDHQHKYYTAMEKHLFEKHRNEDEATSSSWDNVTGESGPNRGVVETTGTRHALAVDNNETTENDANPDNSLGVQAFTENAHAASMYIEPLFCAFCTARFRNESFFRNHVKAHLEPAQPLYRCVLCDLPPVSHLWTLKNHYLHVHEKFLPIFLETVMEPILSFQAPVARANLIIRAAKKCVRNLDRDTYRGRISAGIQCKTLKKCGLDELQKYNNMGSGEKLCVLTCKICGEGPLFKPAMLRHLVRHTQRWPYECPGCHGMFKREEDAQEHVVKFCGAGMTFRLTIRTGELRGQNEQVVALLLEQCAIMTANNKFPGTQAETRRFYSLCEFWCDICKHSTRSFNGMTEHMLDHVDILPYSCTDCGKCFPSRALTQTHINNEKCPGQIKFEKILEFGAREQAITRALMMTTLIEFSTTSLGGGLNEDDVTMTSTNEKCDVMSTDSESSLALHQDNLPDVNWCGPDVSAPQTRGSSPATVYDLASTDSDHLNSEAADAIDESSSMIDAVKRQVYQCRNCSQTFPTVRTFTHHATSHCDQMPWTCSECSCSFRCYKGEDSFLRHARSYHPGQPSSSCKLINESELRKQVHCVNQLLNVVYTSRTSDIVPASEVAPEVSAKRVDKRKQSMDTYTYQNRPTQSPRKQARVERSTSSDGSRDPSTSQTAQSSEPRQRPRLMKNKGWTLLEPLAVCETETRQSTGPESRKHVFAKKRTGRISLPPSIKSRTPESFRHQSTDTLSTDSNSDRSSPVELGAPLVVEKPVNPLHEAPITESRSSVKKATGRAGPLIVSNREAPTFVCPQCQDFDGVWADLLIHYEAMHSDMAVCVKCEGSPCFHIVDFYKHMTQNHPGFNISECSTRRTNSKILANDLLEQLGSISREKYGTMPATWFINCELINVKLSPEGGASRARFVCKQCQHTSRNTESFFAHIAEHLKIGKVHCLHCRHEANWAEMYVHYINRHHAKRPDMLPHSLQYRRYNTLVEKIISKLDYEDSAFSDDERRPGSAGSEQKKSRAQSEHLEDKPRFAEDGAKTLTSSSSTNSKDGHYTDSVGVKQDVKEPSSVRENDSWSFYFFCPYCDHPGVSVVDYRFHLQLKHPRNQATVGLALRLALPDDEVQNIQKAISTTCVTILHAGKTIYQTETSESQRDAPVPDGFVLYEMETASFLQPYNDAMLALYNHFSILETVTVTGSHLSCHLCDVAQTTFPALFEHWNREHLSIFPYYCAVCGCRAKRPESITSHEKRSRSHARNGSTKYLINQDLFDELFANMERLLKDWLVNTKVDSYVPDDWKLVIDPVVRVKDISKDMKYVKYFIRPASPASSVTSLTSSATSTRSIRSRCKLP